MCNGRWVLSLIGVAVTPALRGQSLPQLQARADSLAREWRRANAVADAVDRLERGRAFAGKDTIAVGALRIVTNPSPLPIREAAARAWPVIDSLYGIAARQLERRPYLIMAVDPDTTVKRPRIHNGVAVPWDQDAVSLTLLLVSTVPLARPDTALERWLGGSVVPSFNQQRQRAAVYVQLVTAPSQAARSCFLGNVTGCRDALDLEETGDPLARWYSSAVERRALVVKSFAQYFSYAERAARKPRLEACGRGDDSACTGLLRSLPPGALPRPLTYDARETLVHVALRLGGREAYHRLIESRGAAIGERLADAAHVSSDSLVARWQAEILAARPMPVTLPPWGVWVALGWTAVFAACGLRSSRWRVS